MIAFPIIIVLLAALYAMTLERDIRMSESRRRAIQHDRRVAWERRRRIRSRHFNRKLSPEEMAELFLDPYPE